MKTGFVRAAVLTGALAVSSIVPHATKADNLADALIGAYNSSGLLEQNRALLRAADEDVAIAVSAMRPVINWTLSAQRSYTDFSTNTVTGIQDDSTFFTGLQLDQLLYDGGATKLGKQAAQETVLATRQSLVAVEQQVLLSAVAAYINVLVREENVRLRENNLRVLQEELRAAQDRFEVGEVTRTDVSLAEARVANARSGLASARGQLANAKAQYINAVGHDVGVPGGQPKLPVAPTSLKEAEAVAVRNHPSILAAQHQVAAAELAVRRAATAYGPTAGLRATAGMTEYSGSSDYTDNVTLSLNVQQNIYSGGELSARHRRSMASRDAARANLLNVQKDVVQSVSDALVRLRVAQASLAAAQEQVRASQVAFDGIREEAKLGARTTLDVLTAEQDLLNAMTLRISAQGERSIAAYQVLASQGLLTAERLGLAVQIYDPTLYYNLVKDAPARLSKRGKDLDRVLQALGKK